MDSVVNFSENKNSNINVKNIDEINKDLELETNSNQTSVKEITDLETHSTHDCIIDQPFTDLISEISNGEKTKYGANIMNTDEVADVITLLVDNVANLPISVNTSVSDGERSGDPDNDQMSENDSPIKVKKKKAKNLLDEMENSSDIKTDLNAENEPFDSNQTSELESPIKVKKKKSISSSHEQDDNFDPFNEAVEDNSITGRVEENFSQENTNGIGSDIEDSDLKFEASISSGKKRAERSCVREMKGKELMKQALSLPYFRLPKPDFREYMAETNKRLESPLLEIAPDTTKKTEISKMVTLKPVNNIVFEIGTFKADKVEPFRKKVLSMMNMKAGANSGTVDKSGVSGNKSSSTAVGVKRLSWKMKLLEDIARKKEAVLKERNEMLEEVLENNEEEDQIDESENEDVEENNEVDVHFPDAMSSFMSVEDSHFDKTHADNLARNSQEIPRGVHEDCSTAAMFSSSVNKNWEAEKDIPSSLPLCFSLPSFQPEGGFPKSTDDSSSNIFTTSQVNLSFNEDVSDKISPDISEIKGMELKNSFLQSTISEHDKKFYDKVLAEEKLLVNERSIPGEITADILDICSGQFLDTVEVPKTPPLTNISSDDESDMDGSEENCASDQDIESGLDSDSEEELFKRKGLKKRIRPISPIDEESRHGEEDSRVHPVSELNKMNSNFQFSKNFLSSPTEHNSGSENGYNNDDQSELKYDSEESLICDNKMKFNAVQESTKAINDYFDVEAELSGDEGSSDEDEEDLDGGEALEIDDTEIPSSELLRDQIGMLHLKQLLDDDDRAIREVKNHFLDEGDLYSDAARERKFNWTFNAQEPGNNPGSSGSESEEENNEMPFQHDKLKWKQETADTEVSEVIETQSLEASFKIQVQRKVSAIIIANRAVQGIQAIHKRPRNSFLDEDEANKSFKKIKLDVTNAQGSRATKNFVFVESNKPALRKESRNKNSADSSVFDII